MADLNWLRQAGQEFKDESQQAIKENVDDPMQRAREAIAKLAAHKAASEGGASMVDPRAPMPPQPEVANPIAGGFTASQVQGLEDMQRLRQRDGAMKAQLEAEAAAQMQSEREFDPSQYQQVGQPAPARFQALKKMAAESVQPQAGGPIEMSEDPAEMQRQLEAIRLGR